MQSKNTNKETPNRERGEFFYEKVQNFQGGRLTASLLASALTVALFMGNGLQVCAAKTYYIEDIQEGDELNNGADNRLASEELGSLLWVVFDEKFYPGEYEVIGSDDTYYYSYPVKCPDSKYDNVKSWKVESITRTDGVHYITSTGSSGMGPLYRVVLGPVWETPTPGTGDAGKDSGDDDTRQSEKEDKENDSTPSENYDYVETENGIIYGGLVEGKFAATTVIPAEAYPKFNKFLIKKLQSAKAGDSFAINCEPWTSLSGEVLAAFDASEAQMELRYTYKGTRYTVTIPAGSKLSELADENGYLGFRTLDARFGGSIYTEPVKTEESETEKN